MCPRLRYNVTDSKYREVSGMTYEEKARGAHRNKMSCSASVYNAFADINPHPGEIPAPRSVDGKCGAVLAAEKLLREMGVEDNDFDAQFLARFGSLKCFSLRAKRVPCNDLVGAAAEIVEACVGGGAPRE